MRKTLIFLSFLVLISFSCNKSSQVDANPNGNLVQIHYKYGFNNELNTFANTYKKDLIADGSIKVKFNLSKEEKRKILLKAKELSFFDMPDNFVDEATSQILPSPGRQYLRIKYKQFDKAVTWTITGPANLKKELKSLQELAFLIEEIIHDKSEYKKLPKEHGFYM